MFEVTHFIMPSLFSITGNWFFWVSYRCVAHEMLDIAYPKFSFPNSTSWIRLPFLFCTCKLNPVSLCMQTYSFIFLTIIISKQIWPPSSIKDTGSRLHSKLKEAIVQVRSLKSVPDCAAPCSHNIYVTSCPSVKISAS